MQKLAATLSRAAKPAFVAGATAGSTSTAQCRAPPAAKSKEPQSPGKVSVEEGLEGWGFVQFQAPVEKQEVSNALEELALLGGLRRPASPPPAAVLAPTLRVEELAAQNEEDASSEAGSSSTSDGSEANRLICRADGMEATFGGWEYDEGPADPMENLSAVIGNLLNSPAVVTAIQRELVQDPAFYQLMRQVNPGLPSTARPLLITEITSDVSTEAGDAHPGNSCEEVCNRSGVPLHVLLSRLGQGVVKLAGAVGEAFAHLGNFLRQLGDSLRTSLEGARPVEGRPAAENERRARNWESAIIKVACAVAVVVLAKRVRAFA